VSKIRPPFPLLSAAAALLLCGTCAKESSAQTNPSDLQLNLAVPFHFVAYGDARFHDPKDTVNSNPAVRVALVQAVADANPAFICFTGDLVFHGYDYDDWKVWDRETAPWREKKIPVFPTLGNHELYGDEKIDLANYFLRFPDLNHSRYYSVRAANILILVLDSSLDEVSGAQGDWLNHELDRVPFGVDFVFLVLHHPPYTSSSASTTGEGHEARHQEQALATGIEERQAHAAYRFIVFSGHVHNYERHEHGGVTYFVSGGAGAHAYPIERAHDDPFQSKEINYHYLLVDVEPKQLSVTMHRLDLTTGKPVWTQPDSVKITVPAAAAANAAGQ